MGNIVEVRGLTKRFGENIILDNLNFDIEEGVIFGLIGKSGCGKTTLLNMLIGFLKPNKGKISYRGNNIEDLGNALGRHFGFASQDGSFYKNLTIYENMGYFGRLYGLQKKVIAERAKILLETFGLYDSQETLGQNLSIGMQKRLDIACSLMHDPEVLLLDEPTANLDPALRKNMLELIKKINESGTTIIISSHILDDIKTLCHKVLVIDDKRVAALDTPENLEHQTAMSEMIEIVSEMREYDSLIGSLLNKNAIDNYHVKGEKLILFTKNTKDTLKYINQHFGKGSDSLVNINIVKPSLSHLFSMEEKR